MKAWQLAFVCAGMLGLGLACGCVLFYFVGYQDGVCQAVCSSPLGRPTSDCECATADAE